MGQKFNLGQKVFVFRAQANELQKNNGVIAAAQIDASGYIIYDVMVRREDGKLESWRANHASLADNELDLQRKMSAYMVFNDEQKKKYVEEFGAPEFDCEELGLK